MPPVTKVYHSKDKLTVDSGGELEVKAGGTFTCSGYVASSVTTLDVGGGQGNTGLSVTAAGNVDTDGTLRVRSSSELNGDISVGAHGAAKLSVAAATGVITLPGGMTLDGQVADVAYLGAKLGFCNDASPSAVAAGACVFYFDGTDLKAVTAAGSATLNNAAFQ